MSDKIMLLLFFLCVSAGLAAQDYKTAGNVDPRLRKRYDRAMEYGQARDYPKALKELDDLLRDEPGFIDAHILRASVYFNQGDMARAEGGYEEVLKLGPSYEPQVYYQLAQAEIRQDKFPEAADHLEKFLSLAPSGSRLRQRAEQSLTQVRFAAEAMRQPVPFEPKNIGPSINTPESEYLPSFTADGAFLVYTARVGGQEDFFVSENTGGQWQPGKPLEEINTPLNEGAQTISADGRLLVFTICNHPAGYGRCDLYYSERRDNRWTPPVNMGTPVNSAAWESQPSLSADGKALFFASNRRGTLGNNDIWVSYRKPDGKWGEPQNLGPQVNTPEDDEAPFFHPDGRTLYFMSKGHPGMGGYDLFLTRRGKDGSWSKPQNLGYPINTKANEGAFVVSLDGRTAYFASDGAALPGGSSLNPKATTDIYYFELYPAARPAAVTYVKAVVRDASNHKPLVAAVEFVDLDSNSVYSAATTGTDGSFLVCLPLGKDYALNVSREGYLFHSANFDLADTTASLQNPFLLEIDLDPIPAVSASPGETRPKPVVLRNVFFETGSAALKPASRGELDRLKKLLLENPGLKIRINGHTDNVGSEADNQRLSEGRAKSVYDYLVAQGIDSKRLSYAGFGESRPVDTNDTPEGRGQNRRTEFEVVN